MGTKKTEIDPIGLPYRWAGHHFAGVWQYIIPKDALDWHIPDERNATCDDCPNIAAEEYEELHRCCSYHPIVPNFLIGLALKQKAPRKNVMELYKAGYLLPEGWQRTPHQWVDYITDLSKDMFGRDGGLVKCPMLQKPSGLCGIYAFRVAACSTFYCRNDHGTAGEKFWESLSDYVSQVEMALGQYAMDQLDFDVKAYFKRQDKLAKDLPSVAREDTRGWKEDVLKFLWADWYGKEIEFFEKAGDLISEKRHELVELAQKQPLYDSEAVDLAMNKMVPKEHQHEIDPEDTEEGDLAKPDELWADTKKRYRKLWKIPDQLTLSERATFVKNPKEDDEDKQQRKKPYMIQFLARRGGETVDWHQYLSKKEYETLKIFKRKRRVDNKLMKKIGFKNSEQFLSEWHCKRVLESPLHS